MCPEDNTEARKLIAQTKVRRPLTDSNEALLLPVATSSDDMLQMLPVSPLSNQTDMKHNHPMSLSPDDSSISDSFKRTTPKAWVLLMKLLFIVFCIGNGFKLYDYMSYERAKEIEQERLQLSRPRPKLQSGNIQVKNVNDFEHLEGNISQGANPAKLELDSYIERFESSPSSVLFAHIPKTGGSSVQSLFEWWGKENRIKIRSNMARADVIKPKASSNNVTDIKVFQTHKAWWGYNAIDKTPKADEEIVEFLKVTVLREPVKQFISLYDYALNEPKHPNQKRFQGIFARSTLEGHLNNLKAEMEEGGVSRLSEASHILYHQLHSQMKFLAGLGPNTLSLNSKLTLAEIYEISLTNLESFHVVATQEKLDSSLLPQLKHWLPWADQSTQQLPQLNTHVQRTEKSVLSNDMIEWLNENILVHDNKLYERAKEIERERLQVILDKQRKY